MFLEQSSEVFYTSQSGQVLAGSWLARRVGKRSA